MDGVGIGLFDILPGVDVLLGSLGVEYPGERPVPFQQVIGDDGDVLPHRPHGNEGVLKRPAANDLVRRRFGESKGLQKWDNEDFAHRIFPKIRAVEEIEIEALEKFRHRSRSSVARLKTMCPDCSHGLHFCPFWPL